MVQAGYDLYVVTVPQVGEPATVTLNDPKAAAVPATRLTDIGGEFPTWGADGRHLHWSLGNAHVVYDIDSATAVARRIAAEKTARAAAGKDSTKADPAATKPYEPKETRIVVRAHRDRPEGTVVLRGARVVTMRGTEILENADVVVQGSRIVRVGPKGDAPSGARVVDVTGKTIVPGFVDTHSTCGRRGLHKNSRGDGPRICLRRHDHARPADRRLTLSYEDMVEAGEDWLPSTRPAPASATAEQIRDPTTPARYWRYSDYYDTKYIKMYVKGNRQSVSGSSWRPGEQDLPTTEGSSTPVRLTMLVDGYPGQEHATPTVPLYRDGSRCMRSRGSYTPTLLVQYGGPAEEYY